MNTLQNADTFFYITSIAVIMVSVLVIIMLLYVVKIVQTISQIVSTVRRESENVVDDIAELRGKVKEESMKVGAFWQFVTGFFLNKFTDKMTGSSGAGGSRSSGDRPDRTKTRRKAKASRVEEDGNEDGAQAE